ncbi:MFS-type transporter SLC18B1-like [Ctenocephalides felis]|uniref:MFS-type transporter SLC18B1-like n=1 Tax=Ctenocephalides felis TaxID=7515 RepID=UPI000E6E167F|nr:MFS-type transporter SLC18B1-like [Ctenocephalides felis]XP_026466941.1 MFS-type transporter SLC18B1-like [Ctenocephalides felis]
MVQADPTCSLWLDKNIDSRRGSDFSRLDFDTSSMFESNVQLSSSLDVIDWSKTKIPKRTSINRGSLRSKSLCIIRPKDYTLMEIRRIRERLLRTQPHPKPSAIYNLGSRQRITLAVLALVDFISFCSMSVMAPFFPQEAERKGLTQTETGLVFSFYALVMFAASPLFGKLLPKIGARFLFLSGLFIAGGCSVVFGLLEYVEDRKLFMIFCFFVRGLEALGASAYSTASYVYVVACFPDNIGTVLGLLETFVGLGMSMGPAIGGFLYSLGGFGLPFYAVGILTLFVVPVTMCLLPHNNDLGKTSKPGSLLLLAYCPGVLMTGLVVIVASSAWGFLDPTLEPHLRQFSLSAKQVGLIFLLFSSLYAVSSSFWGWLADKFNNHWSMMFSGLLLCSLGLLLLGPSPLLPLESSLWLNLTSLSILGISIALALLPTFQSVLMFAMDAGCPDSVSTYSVVAGLWSCMYSLGEVIGPTLGGTLLEKFGFPWCSTVMAGITFSLAIASFFFFAFRSPSNAGKSTCDSGMSEYSTIYGTMTDSDDRDPLLTKFYDSDDDNTSHIAYTIEKINYYEQSRRNDQEFGDLDTNQMTDVRGTVNVTSRGACEV